MHILYDNINNYTKNNYKSYISLLTDNDLSKLNKLINNKDKYLLILSRYLLNKLLINNYNIKYKDLDIYYNKYSKPLSNKIYFNISHSHNYSVSCISNKKIGIDIEKIRKVNINTINYFCTDKEKEYINKSNNKYKYLFSIYCLKEAYFKMLGTNLNNIKDIEFTITNNIITCNKNTNIEFKLIYDIDNYVIAIAKEKT